MSGVADAAERIAGTHEAVDGPLVGVRVPATSANLGPGYDALGLALDVPLVAVAGPRGEHRVTPLGFGEGELPTGDDNLVWRGVLAWCTFAGTTPPDVSIEVRSAIPLERGMGSSSAAAVAGLALGRALTGGQASAETMVALAAELEGHPDNAAAAVMGGLTLCLPGGRYRRVAPDPGLLPVVVVPASRQSTNEARAVLPESLPTADAAANAACAMATFAGLAGILPLETDSMRDLLHEPSRLAIMPVSAALVTALRAAGLPAALSGAGPSVLAVLRRGDDRALEVLEEAVRDAAAESGAEVEVVVTAFDLAGVVVCPPGAAAG